MSAESNQPPGSSRADIERLLSLSTRVAQSGNREAARNLLRAITREHPDEPRAWLWLAGVAESAEEQHMALERVLAIEPENTLAQQRLAELQALEEPRPILSPRRSQPAQKDAPTPADTYDEPDSRRWLFPALVLLLIAAILATLVYRGLSLGSTTTVQPTPPLLVVDLTPTMPAVTTTDKIVLPSAVATEELILPGAATPPPAGATGLVGTPESATPTAASANLPIELPMGALREYDGWQATLLRPDYAILLDGAIGDFQPRGRFVLALLSIANNNAAPRRIPGDLFMLLDAQGRSYQPVPNASGVYLATYGRGQRGDLALEDEIQPGGGIVTVPVIFDVPDDAANLRLVMGDVSAGAWPVIIESPGTAPAVPTTSAAP